jgi:tetratricopeptide (TPR) repeat protein
MRLALCKTDRMSHLSRPTTTWGKNTAYDPLAVTIAWNGLGVAYYELGDWQQAEHAYASAIDWLKRASEGKSLLLQRQDTIFVTLDNNLGQRAHGPCRRDETKQLAQARDRGLRAGAHRRA